MSQLKKHFKISIFAFLIFSFLFFILDSTALAQFGLKETAEKAGLLPSEPIGPAAMAGAIIGYALAFVGVIFFALMIYGGYLWMTARGKEEQVKKARDIIETAIIGIVIIFLAYTITNFVVSKLTEGAGISGGGGDPCIADCQELYPTAEEQKKELGTTCEEVCAQE